jgi:uncharacterized membrane protein (DUF485 family)
VRWPADLFARRAWCGKQSCLPNRFSKFKDSTMRNVFIIIMFLLSITMLNLSLDYMDPVITTGIHPAIGLPLAFIFIVVVYIMTAKNIDHVNDMDRVDAHFDDK